MIQNMGNWYKANPDYGYQSTMPKPIKKSLIRAFKGQKVQEFACAFLFGALFALVIDLAIYMVKANG